MNEQMSEVMQYRRVLLARISSQREQMNEIGVHLRPPLSLADRGLALLRHLRNKPWLIAGVVAILAVRSRGKAGLMKWIYRVWQGYRYFVFPSSRL